MAKKCNYSYEMYTLKRDAVVFSRLSKKQKKRQKQQQKLQNLSLVSAQ